MLNLILGEPIANAVRSTYHNDGFNGKLNALIVVTSVVFFFVHNLIELLT